MQRNTCSILHPWGIRCDTDVKARKYWLAGNWQAVAYRFHSAQGDSAPLQTKLLRREQSVKAPRHWGLSSPYSPSFVIPHPRHLCVSLTPLDRGYASRQARRKEHAIRCLAIHRLSTSHLGVLLYRRPAHRFLRIIFSTFLIV